MEPTPSLNCCLRELIKAKEFFYVKEIRIRNRLPRVRKKKSAPAVTVSRNTPIPRPSAVKREITHEMIAKRAYEIFVPAKAASQTDNWFEPNANSGR